MPTTSTPYYRVDPEHSGEYGREIWVLGPPGCGKTTFLAGSVRNTALQRGRDSVSVVSFTTAAAAEIGGRDTGLHPRQYGTLHSMAKRSLEGDNVVYLDQLTEWNEHHPGWALKGEARSLDDPGAPAGSGANGSGDTLMTSCEYLRNRLIPRDEWPSAERTFFAAWDDWKSANGLIDFTDMVEYALHDTDGAPGRPDVLYADEVQDFTPLELALVRKWGKRAERLVLCGDDDQCQIPTDEVLTQHGYVQMQHLDPAEHRVVAMDVRGGCNIRRRTGGRSGVEGFAINVAKRPYDGPMVKVTAGNGTATFTPHHRFAARWVQRPGWAVYLMRRGDHWRVGVTAMFRSVGKDRGSVVYGVGTRARGERADEAWVLSVWSDSGQAHLEECRVAAVYGFSQAVFHAPATGQTLQVSQQQLDMHHDLISKTARPLDALRDHGRHPEYPAWKRDGKHRGRDTVLTVEACNLLPGWMLLPIDEGTDKPAWVDFTTENTTYSGDVYSLDVETHHTYVTNGMVTRNSIYAFRGALPEAWLDQPVEDSDKIVLSQSWRIPASVHRAAEHWIRQLDRREEKIYHPRDEEGVVRTSPISYRQPHLLADEIEAALAGVDSEGNPATVMVIAPCAFMVDPIRKELRERGIPFSNPWQRRRGDWNPFPPIGGKNISSRERLLAYLSLDEREFPSGPWHRPEGWTGEDVRRWAHTVKKRGVFARGAAAALDALPNGAVSFDDLAGLFVDDAELDQAVTPDLDWLERNLTAASRAGMTFPISVARKRGAQALLEEPRVHIGTAHSFKGAQATTVFLVPDLSRMFMREWNDRGPGRDSIRRLFYVAMTRARRELVVLNPGEPQMYVDPARLVKGAKVPA